MAPLPLFQIMKPVSLMDGTVLEIILLPANSVTKEINMEGYVSGAYLLIYQNGNDTKSIKLIKK